MIAPAILHSRSQRLQKHTTDARHGWSMRIIDIRNSVRFILWHNTWPRGVEVTAATLRNRKRFEVAVLEQVLVWPNERELDRLFGSVAQWGEWMPGVIGSVLEEARTEYKAEAGK